MLIFDMADYSTEKHAFESWIIVYTNQPATFSTADAIFVSGNQTAAEEFLGEPVYLRHRRTRMWGGNMAGADEWSVLEECVKKINTNTAQPENFLRQVSAACVLFKTLLNVVATSFAHV